MNNIIGYFYLEDINNQSNYGVQEKNYYKKNEYYIRCIINFFCSSLKFNDNCKHWFITNNIKGLDDICNIKISEFCTKYNIQIVEKESSNVVKNDNWAGSLYFFDALDFFNNNNNKLDKYIFFDNDVFFTKNIDEFINYDFDYLLYDISHEYKVGTKWLNFNGIDIGSFKDELIPYGGELFGIRGGEIKYFIEEFNEVKKNTNDLKTEEHFISFLMKDIIKNKKVKISLANDIIKRCWTTLKYNNVERNDYKYPVIHVPSEKEFGIFWYNKNSFTPNEFDVEKLMKMCGIRERSNRIKIKIVFKKIIQKLKEGIR